MNLRCTLLLALGLTCFGAIAQSEPTPSLSNGLYVVVAAYLKGQESFARNYTDKLNQEGRHAKYGFDNTRSLYYVYLDQYQDFNESIRQMLKTREAGFPKAWVRVLKDAATASTQTPGPETPPTITTTKPPVEEKKEPAKENPTTVLVPQIITQPTDSTQKVKTEIPVEPTVDNPPADPVFRPQILKNTPVFLSLYNPTNQAVVDGEIEVVDTERAKLITKVKGNDYLKLPDPGSKSGQLTLISSSFGYRKVQHELNYKSTEKDTLQSYVSLVGNYYMISFEMVRLHKGDIATLYNVYFYNDAAVMLPDSKYELNKLLQMLKDNPAYKITLHGHTNGRSAGKLITRGESNNFFELSSDVKRGVGSAKDLSRERAEIIKDWLVVNGIAADRMEIKAWGGQRMIHDKNGPHARKNVRVEVEVTQE